MNTRDFAPPVSTERVATAAAHYTRALLAVYDPFVLGHVCRRVWRCDRSRMIELYDRNVGVRHLDLGPGTGYFVDRCRYPVAAPEITLLDLGETALSRASYRIRRYGPQVVRGDVLRPFRVDPHAFDSVGMNFLLHCLPGGMRYKARVFDHAAVCLVAGGRLFGSTVLGASGEHTARARRLMHRLNARALFDNVDDSLADLDRELSSRFGDVRIAVRGSVALFEARV